VNVSVNEFRRNFKAEDFSKSLIPVGYLLEGYFTSLFKNRFLPEAADSKQFREVSVPTKIIVIADGDLARNEIHPRTRQPQPLGFDPFSNYTFANEDLLLNMLAWLTDENGLIKARNKEIKIRPLDHERVASQKLMWQMINIAVPLVLLIAFGMIKIVVRRNRFAKF